MTIQFTMTKKQHRQTQLFLFSHSRPGMAIMLGFFALCFFSALFVLPGLLAEVWYKALLLALLALLLICGSLALTMRARTALLYADGSVGAMEMHFGEKELTVLAAQSAQSFSYATLSRLLHRRGVLYLYFGGATGFALPAAALSSRDEAEALLAHIEKKANLRLRRAARDNLLRRIGETEAANSQ